MYTVKQVASRTGVRETTLRAWERRYGLVHPVRSDGGYRLYDDAQVDLLRRMAALVDSGVPAAMAAESLLAADPGGRSPAVLDEGPDLVAAAADLNPRRLGAVLDDAFARRPYEEVVDDWLAPQLARLGEAWAAGLVSVAQEHFVSVGVLGKLASLYAATIPAHSGAPILVGLPEGGRHELMIFAFAVCLRLRGADVVYLGADVPVAEWELAVRTLLPRVVVLGVHGAGDVAPARAVVQRLAGLQPPVTVMAGGSRRDEVQGAQAMDDRIGAAADQLLVRLRAGAV
ncbi:MerR family transcriptional regulator [Raineyella fluvialis]|uniref:MerR family transcriptional regulator n=1 Tax=Raineyella fluvialis TaxID=2662261 RepID=UPI00188F9818|nr:MerR family transcriptional regulator [Raineyella fluvialis]